jgi:hypothetical protein
MVTEKGNLCFEVLGNYCCKNKGNLGFVKFSRRFYGLKII